MTRKNKQGNSLSVRIQRSRRQKQSSPNDLPIKYAGRPTVYGNRYRVGAHHGGRVLDAVSAIELYRTDFYNDPELMERARRELSDKNLSCWCRLDAPCHVEVLLEFLAANR